MYSIFFQLIDELGNAGVIQTLLQWSVFTVVLINDKNLFMTKNLFFKRKDAGRTQVHINTVVTVIEA